MRKFIPLAFGLGLLLGSIGTLYAVNFTIVLTQAQVDVATWKWNQVDPSHTLYATAQLFGAAQVGNDIDGWRRDRWNDRLANFGSATGYFCTNTWPGLSQGTKDGICTARNEATGCNVCDAAGN